jgi:DNA-binding MarR family transcriptional regulator
MDRSVELLQELGFSPYEAKAYVALLQDAPLNGYELARKSGIPRANVYAVLQKLEERGAVLRLDSPAGVRYSPVAPEDLAARLQSRFQNALDSAGSALKEITSRIEPAPVLNTHGYPALLEHALNLVDGSEKQLLLAVWPQEAQALSASVQKAQERHVATTTLCLAGCAQECGACRGNIFRYPFYGDQRARWLVVVPDGEAMLAGEIGPGDQAQAVQTRQAMLVNLAGKYIRYHVALAAILLDAGDHLEEMLDPRTLAVLNSLIPGGNWMDEMKRLLKRGE